MEAEYWVAIITSLVAGVGIIATSIYQVVQTVQDARKIKEIDQKGDSINKKGTKIYSDTQIIKEDTKNLNIIESNVIETKNTVLPAAIQITEMKDNIKELANDLAARKKLNEYVSQGLNAEDTINRVSAVFEKNAKLSKALEVEQQNHQLLNLQYQKVIEEKKVLQCELDKLKTDIERKQTKKHTLDHNR